MAKNFKNVPITESQFEDILFSFDRNITEKKTFPRSKTTGLKYARIELIEDNQVVAFKEVIGGQKNCYQVVYID